MLTYVMGLANNAINVEIDLFLYSASSRKGRIHHVALMIHKETPKS